MGILDYIYNAGLKQSTNLVNNTDYLIAKELRDEVFYKKSGKLLFEEKIYFEGIFLDLSDRSGMHPQISYKTKDIKPSFMDKLYGIDERKKIIWEYDKYFDIESYFTKEWFDISVNLHVQLKEELILAKNYYKEEKISFFEYYSKRNQVYKITKPSNFVKFTQNVDLDLHEKKLREIFEIILKEKNK